MISRIRQSAQQRGISRLCHFTPSRNLPHIAADKKGILATANLEQDELAVFTTTDTHRFDGFTSHVSCSIEYPNAWYMEKAQGNEHIFKDWVVLFIRPQYLWHDGTRFCPRNAAAQRGSLIGTGFDAFEALFRNATRGAYNRLHVRSSSHPNCCPTDDQAEVLVPNRIALSDVIGVAVRSEAQAKREMSRLRILGVKDETFRFVIAPMLFQPDALSEAIRRGRLPRETPFNR